MKHTEIIPQDTRYIPLTQQRWHCVPTCIQMIMLRHDISLVPAELIGYHMGIIIPKEELQYFWHGRTGKRPASGYGTLANKKQYAPNSVFKELNIPLKMTWQLINKFPTIENYKNYLSNVETNNKDVLVCYDWGTLFDKDYQCGHVCVLDKVYLDKGEIRIIDPEYEAPKWRIVTISKLYEAMQFHGKDKSGGFWELQYEKQSYI